MFSLKASFRSKSHELCSPIQVGLVFLPLLFCLESHGAAPVTESRTAGSAAQANFQAGTTAWTNITNATGATNSSYATVSLSTNTPSRKLSLTNFGFAIPADATILSVQPIVRLRRTNTAANLDYLARLTSSLGASPSWPDVANWPTAATSRTYTGGTPLWNLALTPTVINASSFGFEMASVRYQFANTASAEIDSVQIDVRYVRWAAGEVGGVAFRDFDADGVRDHGETPLSGITIKAYNSANVEIGSTTTDADGAWTLAIADGQAARIEASGLPAGHTDAPLGSSSASLVRFVTAPAGNVNFGLIKPGGDSAGEPWLSTPCYVAGDSEKGPNKDAHVLVMAPYGATAEINSTGITSSPAPTSLADAIHIGATYGLAYQHASKSVFAGAFAKRKSDYGPDGPGAIYKIGPGIDGNLGTSDDTRGLFLDLNALFSGAAGTDHHSTDSTNLLNDDGVIVPFIGKEGLGDIDISADGMTLYAVALGNKTLYEIPIGNPPIAPAAGSIRAYPLPSGIFPSIPDDDVRPFGIGIKGNRVFVGGVTTAESTVTDHTNADSGDETKLNAVVWEIALQTTGGTHPNKYTQAFSFRLDSARADWRAWSNLDTINGHSEAILSDIEFDGNDMILGLRDRYGDKTPMANKTPLDDPWPASRGDILRAAWNGTAFVLESNGVAGSLTGSGAGNGQGPGGGEYYAGEDPSDGGIEGAQGALAFHSGRREVISIVYDPINTFINEAFFSNGWTQFNLNGSERNSYVVFDLADPGTYGKAAGLGDLELIQTPTGVSVGNRVWADQDGDGIQDADETGIAGVTVTLKAPGGSTIASALTDSAGNYSFSSQTGTDTASAKFGLSALSAGTSGYKLCVARADAALSGKVVTLANNDATANGDERDSDSLANGLNAEIGFNISASGGNDFSLDFGFASAGALGNRVWLDEDSDGRQDIGEPGLPNVTVLLCRADGVTEIARTTTDTHGGYIFSDIPVGSYVVKPLASSLHPALSQTPTDGNNSDFGNKPQAGYSVTIGGIQPTENLTADFGYNWQLSANVNGNTGTGVIGDRVWYDCDGDGRKDPEELGIPNIVVELVTPGPDGLFRTLDDIHGLGADSDVGGSGANADVPSLLAITDANGCYRFTNLTPGIYCIKIPLKPNFDDGIDPLNGMYQTGDPDHFGGPKPPALPDGDGETTVPVFLGPGDVWLNGDFGFKLVAGQVGSMGGEGSVGGKIWFDANGSGTSTQDAGELGIPSVTVALIKDLDGDGICDPGEPIIASDSTDSNGDYLFPCVPRDDGDGDADYLVMVTDTENVLAGLSQSYDQDAPLDEKSNTVLTPGVASDLSQNFSYTVPGQAPGEGLIGDTVYLDLNGDGDQDPGEPGLEGVTVKLCDDGVDNDPATAGDNQVIAIVVTDENGRYAFGNLPIGQNYLVKVDPTTLPAGLTQTDDPDITNDSTSTVTSLAGVNLLQDFGYQGTRRIGNLVWNDLNADGDYDAATESPIGGVTLDLYRDLNGNDRVDPGEPLISSTTTASSIDSGLFGANGNYCFAGLPSGDYVVDVTDEAGLLLGYWHSRGTDDTDNHSQADPYDLSVAAADNKVSDFGYYVQPASLGDFVFHDLNGDGDQDSGEPGINGATLTLCVTYPDGTVVTIKTVSGDNLLTVPVETGWYSFANLLLDEDFNGLGTVFGTGGDEPRHEVKILDPLPITGLVPTTSNKAGVSDDLDSDDPAGETAEVVEGSSDPSNDFGFTKPRSWEAFQSLITAVGQDGPLQNADADSWANALEYALCLNPNSGVESQPGFCAVTGSGGEIEAIFNRPAGGLADVTYCLQARATLPTGADTWTTIKTIPGTGAPGPGVTIASFGALEQLRVTNIAAIAPLTTNAGFIRLVAKVDDDADALTPPVNAVSLVQGWKRTVFDQNECVTYANPFLAKETLSGAVASVSGNQISIASLNTTNLSTVLSLSSKKYYLEVVEGDNAGHRFDITAAGLGTLTLANDANLCAGPPYNSVTGVPGNLASDRFIVREHQTLAGEFPPSAFVASNDSGDADRVLLHDGTAWRIYYLQSASPNKWVDVSDNTMADAGSTVLAPGQGYFVHPDSLRAPPLLSPPGPIEKLAMGMVRQNAFCLPLNPGFTLVAGGFPQDQSPVERALDNPADISGGLDPSKSDQIHLWNGDSPSYKESFDCFFYIEGFGAPYDNNWSNIADANLTAVDSLKLLKQDRSAFYFRVSISCRADYCMPLNWLPSAQ